jgi:hypothetical protein
MGYSGTDSTAEDIHPLINSDTGEMNFDGKRFSTYYNKAVKVPEIVDTNLEDRKDTLRVPDKCKDFLYSLTNIQSELIRNKIKNRVCVSSYNANDPSEDVFNAIQLKNIDGYYLTVLDGHGGVEVANLANQRIHVLFDKYIKEHKEDQIENIIEEVLNKVYNQVDEEIYQKAINDWKEGDGRLAFTGTCVLTAIVIDDSLYIANLGDSKARLFRRCDDGYEAIKISKTYNANKVEERKRLTTKYADKDIVTVNKNTWYVKGRLAPTRVNLDNYRPLEIHI